MKITDDLKIVLPIRSDEKGPLIYAYSIPLSKEVFEANYRVLAATKSELASKGIHYQMDAGPRIASLVLSDEAKKDAIDFDEDGSPKDTIANALLAEIRRLTTVLTPSDSGWDMVPVDTAIKSGFIEREEWDEVESALVFFMCHYSMARRTERVAMADALASLLKGSITSLALSAFVNSLQKLTGEDDLTALVESSAPR